MTNVILENIHLYLLYKPYLSYSHKFINRDKSTQGEVEQYLTCTVLFGRIVVLSTDNCSTRLAVKKIQFSQCSHVQGWIFSLIYQRENKLIHIAAPPQNMRKICTTLDKSLAPLAIAADVILSRIIDHFYMDTHVCIINLNVAMNAM